MISVDGSLILQIINFIFLIWALNVVLYKPIRKVLQQRKGRISDLEKGLSRSTVEMGEKDEAFKKGIQAARGEGLKEKEAYLDEASAEEHQIIDAINQKAQAELAAVRDKIAKDAAGVRQSLMQEVDAFAEAIGKKILGRAIS
jgi:F-type H+-transporting ATPase subunit b